MKFKNFQNSYTSDNRIYSNEELYNMPLNKLVSMEKELGAQYGSIGFPMESELRESENVVYVHAYTRDDGTNVKSHWRSKPDSSKNDGAITGGASKINRNKELFNLKDLPQNNDDFFERKRQNPQSIFMRKNADLNNERPDAKLFMDIALVGPQNIPSTQDYQFVSSKETKNLNAKYNLTGNKKIPNHYDGFKFSASSPTAQALNSSEEFKEQIFNEKNYNSTTHQFKTNQLEIEFKNDRNLQYSFGHMTVLNPKIKDGYITGIGYDKYDYSILYKGFYNRNIKTTFFNDAAKLLQMSGKLHNFYIFIPIKIKI